jgi:hypothetical protein
MIALPELIFSNNALSSTYRRYANHKTSRKHLYLLCTAVLGRGICEVLDASVLSAACHTDKYHYQLHDASVLQYVGY